MLAPRTVLTLIVLLSTAPLPAAAQTLDAEAAIELLVGSTWAGVNEDAQAFWFWHEGGPRNGRFAAKFVADGEEAEYHSGRWARESAQICWTWPAWNARHCYVDFRIDAGQLQLIRRDGVVHSGTLTPGNSENLVP